MKHLLPGLAFVALLQATTGCAGRIATFNVLRPAALDTTRVGNTMTVGTITDDGHPDAAQQVSADLLDRIAHSLNPTVRLATDGGSVQIRGSIVHNDADESSVYVSATCSRSVYDGTDANGNQQWHSESYDCSYWQRIVSLSVAVDLSVQDALHGTLLFDQTYSGADTLNNPSAARVEQRMRELRAAAVSQFSRVILPWTQSVRERFESCGRDPACAQGFDHVRRGDLADAEAAFTTVIGSYDHAGNIVPAAQARRIGEALYDRGVTRAYRWEFDAAEGDLARATSLQPRQMAWQGELYRVQQMQRDASSLQQQWHGSQAAGDTLASNQASSGGSANP